MVVGWCALFHINFPSYHNINPFISVFSIQARSILLHINDTRCLTNNNNVRCKLRIYLSMFLNGKTTIVRFNIHCTRIYVGRRLSIVDCVSNIRWKEDAKSQEKRMENISIMNWNSKLEYWILVDNHRSRFFNQW